MGWSIKRALVDGRAVWIGIQIGANPLRYKGLQHLDGRDSLCQGVRQIGRLLKRFFGAFAGLRL